MKGLEFEKMSQAYGRFTSHFHNPTIQENIRKSKEEQYQGEFLKELEKARKKETYNDNNGFKPLVGENSIDPSVEVSDEPFVTYKHILLT